MLVFREPISFVWDSGNSEKSTRKHGVTNEECEEVFFDPQKRMLRDALHSQGEERYVLIGATKTERVLYMVFTMRKRMIRVISARDLNRKERHLYGKSAA